MGRTAFNFIQIIQVPDDAFFSFLFDPPHLPVLASDLFVLNALEHKVMKRA